MEFEKPSLHSLELSKFLIDYRAEHKISMEELGYEIGVSTTAVWEYGGKPNPYSISLLKDYFGIDVSIKYAFYTSDGRLMFEGSRELFLRYLGVSRESFYRLVREGSVIVRELPCSEGESEAYKTYNVLAESIDLQGTKLHEAFINGRLVAQGSIDEIAEQLERSERSIRWYKSMTGKLQQKNFIEVHHVGYRFNENLEDVA